LCQNGIDSASSFAAATTTIIAGLAACRMGKTAGCNGSSQHDRATLESQGPARHPLHERPAPENGPTSSLSHYIPPGSFARESKGGFSSSARPRPTKRRLRGRPLRTLFPRSPRTLALAVQQAPPMV